MSQKKKSLADIIANAVKSVFNAEAETKEKMAEATLADGTVLTAEAFEEGQVLYITTAEEDFVVAPAGEYTLSDGTVLTVNDEGVISAIVPAAEATETEEEEKEEMSKYVTREDFEKFATELLSAVTKIVKVNQSAQEKKTEQTDEQKAKIEAAKAEFSRRKKIGSEKTEEKESEKEVRQFKHAHVHPIKARIKEAFKDFDYN